MRLLSDKLPEGFTGVGGIVSIIEQTELPTENFQANSNIKDGIIFENKDSKDMICVKFINLQNNEVYELYKTSELKQQELDERNKNSD